MLDVLIDVKCMSLHAVTDCRNQKNPIAVKAVVIQAIAASAMSHNSRLIRTASLIELIGRALRITP
jgi:hypothetical protein